MSDYWPDTPAGPLFEKPAAACTAKAVRVAGFDTGAARAAILEALTKSGRAMTGEELVDHCQRLGLVPHDARAFGSVFSGLAKQNKIVSVGFAARRKGHGTAGARLWRMGVKVKTITSAGGTANE